MHDTETEVDRTLPVGRPANGRNERIVHDDAWGLLFPGIVGNRNDGLDRLYPMRHPGPLLPGKKGVTTKMLFGIVNVLPDAPKKIHR
jgi:hypothetical protein